MYSTHLLQRAALVDGGTGCGSYIPQINTYSVMRRHLIDQGSAFTLDFNTLLDIWLG